MTINSATKKMANSIINDIQHDFPNLLTNIDIKQLIEYCKLSNCIDVKECEDNDIETLSDEVTISQLTFSDTVDSVNWENIKNTKIMTIIKKKSFINRYTLLIKIIYCLIKIGVSIFRKKNNNIIIKNFRTLKISLDKEKKNTIIWFRNELDDMICNKNKFTFEAYLKNHTTFSIKIKMIDKLINVINTFYEKGILDETDTLYQLISPFFYQYDDDYLEVYEYGSVKKK
jgi:hypothetical protein